MSNNLRVLFAGSGSGGPVAPLIAVSEKLKALAPNASFLLVGTNEGPAQRLAQSAGLDFASISSGKLHRYWTIKNLITPFLVVVGFLQALKIIKHFKPNAAMGAGGFAQVPVLWAAKLLGVPILIHQQDVAPTLANKLCVPIAKKITVTFEQSLKDFSSGLLTASVERVVYTGNPIRDIINHADKTEARAYFGLHSDLPVLLVVGGGTGAQGINRLITAELSELAKIVQIIHVTGKGKSLGEKHPNYHAYEFLDRIDYGYAVADLVISRAGLNFISELSALAKISIIIPIPDSHQESNALLLAQKRAAVAIDQGNLNPALLRKIVRAVIFEPELQKELSENIFKLMPHDAAKQIAALLLDLGN